MALLLVDLIHVRDVYVRSTDMTWAEAKAILQGDKRYDSVRSLSDSEKAGLFLEHVVVLKSKRRAAYCKMLDGCAEITLATEWEAARSMVCIDDVFIKYSDDEEVRKQAYTVYMVNRKERSVADFRELLAETRAITHKSWTTINEEREEGKAVTMNVILKSLQLDSRHVALEPFPEERADILSGYLVDRDRQGSPPPATATIVANPYE